MHRTLRHFARSSHLRVMAWLAWLILAVAPVHATPGGMMDMATAMGQGTHPAQMSGHMNHATPLKADCCGDADHADHAATAACHCAATCSTVLPVMTMVVLSALPPGVMQVPLHAAAAPKLLHAPLLRPPLLQVSKLT